MATSNTYDSIEKNVHEESSLLTEESTASTPAPRKDNRVFMAGVGLLFVVAMAAWNGNISWQDNTLSISAPLWGREKQPAKQRTKDIERDDDYAVDDDGDEVDAVSSSKKGNSGGDVRQCSFLECWKGQCNWKDAPYICLSQNVSSDFGCSASPWDGATCEDQCDLSGCRDVEIPKSVDSCKHKQCSDEWCCGISKCPSDMSYQCMSGVALYGCHSDPYEWMIKVNDATCSECCDTKTCPEDTSKCEEIMKSQEEAVPEESAGSMKTVTFSFFALTILSMMIIW